jgi:hypothetical protein
MAKGKRQIKVRVTIEHDDPWPPGLDRLSLRDREEHRYMTRETVPGLTSAAVKVELIDE